MGLKQRTSTGSYVRLKDGKFYLPNDESKTAYDELEGKLVDIYLKDETYEGQPLRKLYAVMNDGDQNLIVSFRFDSRYATSFLTFLKNVDLKEPFTLCPIVNEKKDARGETVKEASILIKQDGSFAKSYYSKDKPNGLPQMKQIKVNGKLVWDKTEMLDFFENVVENEIKPALPKAESKIVIREEAESTPTYVEEDVEGEDELPWEK